MADESPTGRGTDDAAGRGADDAAGRGTDDAADHDPPAVDGPVLLFDGVCNLCNGAVQFVIERDPRGTIKFAPLQSDVARALLADTDLSPDQRDTVVLVEDGDYYTKSGAAIRVAEHLGGVYRLATLGRLVPRFVRDRAYDFVADHRYGWFGKRDQCMVPTPEVRERFLEMDPVEG